uniref:Uncharacterized protein n=1 Tax=Lotharella globosa TaxID=91324 RepID=A0A7S3ZBW1_9EUKA
METRALGLAYLSGAYRFVQGDADADAWGSCFVILLEELFSILISTGAPPVLLIPTAGVLNDSICGFAGSYSSSEGTNTLRTLLAGVAKPPLRFRPPLILYPFTP